MTQIYLLIVQLSQSLLFLVDPLLSEVGKLHRNPDFRGYCSKERGGTLAEPFF